LENAVPLIHEGLQEMRPYVAAYGVWALFVVLYLESLGAPLPGESALVASAFLASTGELLLTHVLLAGFVGAVAGDSTGYMIGRAGGRPLLIKFGPKIGLNAARFERVERLFQRKGVWVVLTARFVVLLRQLNGLVAGSMRMHFPRFLMANAAGAALWVIVWVFIGYTFGHEIA
jgi:membrane protein DedA with SNARE-associated domain